ncbi:Phosphotransferase enzyme family protein [Aspergillus sclerotialis]|uniref:Phosphotransferase enzyme family protein n=1 Tax=Aspergillus sclerotialis TaxID=2070753 RepID=A0A3A3A0U7_9EURO|nr:Phosphotransferase enzyme family protein [Aspergillus sclerotialis]
MCRSSSTRRWYFSRNGLSVLKQYCHSISKARKLSYNYSPAGLSSSQVDWNSDDEFFKFTRGRFIVDETENLRRREIRFDVNQLAKAAADSIGAAQCVSIKKYPDGMFKKEFLLSMGNGREVVAKVPNPNAGIPHFTTE